MQATVQKVESGLTTTKGTPYQKVTINNTVYSVFEAPDIKVGSVIEYVETKSPDGRYTNLRDLKVVRQAAQEDIPQLITIPDTSCVKLAAEIIFAKYSTGDDAMSRDVIGTVYELAFRLKDMQLALSEATTRNACQEQAAWFMNLVADMRRENDEVPEPEPESEPEPEPEPKEKKAITAPF